MAESEFISPSREGLSLRNYPAGFCLATKGPFVQTSTHSPDSFHALVKHSVKPVHPERREGISDLERAAELIEHAIQYLVTEQLRDRRSPVQANHGAIALLCDAAGQIARVERRKSDRSLIAGWLRGGSLVRATQNPADDSDL